LPTAMGPANFHSIDRLTSFLLNSPAKPPALPERIEEVTQLRE
jgi:hypothetical protein